MTAIFAATDSSFFDAGLYVWPGHPLYPRQVTLHDGGILVLDGTSQVEEGLVLSGLGLENPAPNPLMRETSISYIMPRTDHVRLLIIDAQGRIVKRLTESEQPPGRHRIAWDGTNARD